MISALFFGAACCVAHSRVRTIYKAGSGSLAEDGIHSVCALLIYSLLSLLFFGPRTLRHFSQAYRGSGFDPTVYMWSMIWWPYAIAHRINPFFSKVIWAPVGYNLTRATTMPGPSIIVYPLTRIFGPVAAHNVLWLACTAAAAYSAFLLCRYICHCFWPAAVGGYIFGFSQYMLSQAGGHLVLLFIFPVPLSIYLVLLRLEKSIGRYSFLLLFGLVVAFEFLSSTELFATTTLFGAMMLTLSFVLFTDLRSRIRSVIAEIVVAYVILTLSLSLYLYNILAAGVPPVVNPAKTFSNDLLAFVLPSRVLLGGKLFAPITRQFKSGGLEMAAYLGPGVWLITALFARTYWRTNCGRLLLVGLVLIASASLGPNLHVAGVPLAPLPWIIADKLPLVNLALPGRFGMYLFLVAGVIVAIYLSDPAITPLSRTVLATCALVFIAPNLRLIQSQATRVEAPAFFTSGEYQRYISKNDIVLILPGGPTSQTLLWQAQTHFYFRLITGFYLPPAGYQRWPVVASFATNRMVHDFREQLEAFLGANHVKAVIVDGSSPGPWPGMFSELGMAGVAVGGVLFYKVPARVLILFRDATPQQMAERQAARCFSTLVIAASRYLDGGFPLAKLTPQEAQQLKLLNLDEGESPAKGHSNWWQNLWLGDWGGLVGVGIVGSYQDLEFLIHDYGPEASAIYFPFPEQLGKTPKSASSGLLLLSFTPDGLRRAVRKIIGVRNPT
jgi:hypothetical protein